MSQTTAARTASSRPPRPNRAMTIGGLARAAAVGVETVRYYQRRHLLPVPESAEGAVRRYPADLVERIRFIKQSQNLGFSLDEIRELMRLEDGGSRNSIRKIADSRLTNIRDKIASLQRMERVLAQLLCECEHTNSAAPCPIIAALSTNRPHAGNT